MAERLKALLSQLLPLKGRSWVRAPGLRQTQSKLVVRKISAIRARLSNGIYNSRISIPRVLTNRKILRIKYSHPTKSLVDGGKTRKKIKLKVYIFVRLDGCNAWVFFVIASAYEERGIHSIWGSRHLLNRPP